MADNILTAPEEDGFNAWLRDRLGVGPVAIDGPSIVGDFGHAVSPSTAEHRGVHLDLG